MSWANRHPKYLRGALIGDTKQAVDLILAGKWLIFNQKPMHPAVLSNWSLYQVRAAVHRGMMREAIDNPAHTSSPIASAVTDFAAPTDAKFEEVF